MADEDPYISPLKPAVPLPRINQNPNKFHVQFMYKAAVIAAFIVFLPFLPSQAPEFINQTLHTRSWEFLQILFVGIAVSYGLFSRKNYETEKDHSSKVDNAHTYVSRFLEVSSVFEDEAVEDSKVQTWNSQYHREEPTVMVAQESLQVDEWTRIRSGANEKPLLLPVRSLKSRVSDSDFALEAKELSDSLRRSSSFTTSSRPSNSSFGGYNGHNLEEENVVLRSPIPWRSRSGRMEMKEEIDGIPPYSLPSPMADSSFRPFESNSYGPQDGPYGPQNGPQNARSPRPNSAPRTPKKKSPSPSKSPPKLSPPPNLSAEFQAKNAAAEAARLNTYYKTTPPPPPPPPPPRSGRMEMKEEIDGIPPYSLPSPMAESSFRPFESNTYGPQNGPYGPQNARSRGPNSTPKKKSPSPSQSPPKLSPPPTLSAELQPKNAAERARRNTYYQTNPPPPPPPPPQPLYARKPPLVKSNSTLSGSEFYSAKEPTRTIRSVPSYPIEPELVLERASSGSEPKKRVGSDGPVAGKSVRTVESVGSVLLAGNSVRTVEPSYPHMSEAGFRGYEKEFDETMSEESEEDEEPDEDVVKEEASSPISGGEDVNQKADEFIAKFREQIRLQRIESIKRSTAQIARRNSSR